MTELALLPEVEDEEYDDYHDSYTLVLGGLALHIVMPNDRGNEHFKTSIFRFDDEKKPGSTTALYTRAYELMQRRVDTLNRPVRYELSTDNEVMVEFARTKGREIFDWDYELPKPDKYIAGKILQPSVEDQ